MKRLQISIDEDLDAALAARARREGSSKSALVRQAVRRLLGLEPDRDPLDDLVGLIDDRAAAIDDLLYGVEAETSRSADRRDTLTATDNS